MIDQLTSYTDFSASFLGNESELPLLIKPTQKNQSLFDLVSEHKETFDKCLNKYGGILYRGFALSGVDEFQDMVESCYGDPLDYNDRATKRSQVKGKVFTATDYPPDQEILLHNESSFASKFPRKIFFYSIQTAESGGETPIADVRKVYNHIDPSIRKPFEDEGVLYVRNFTGGPFGFKWQEVYQTEDKSEMESYCAESDIEFEWTSEDKVKTWQKRPATAKHPVTGESLWINHATVLNVYSIEPKLQNMMLKFFKPKDLPNNTYYGNGETIEEETIRKLKKAYDDETVTFTWENGDVLMLDNMMVAHGRRPFSGKRQVVVAMSNPIAWNEL